MKDQDRCETDTSRREFLRRTGMTAAALGVAAAVGKLPGMSAPAGKRTMQYRPLGNTGHESSLLCFGGVMLDGESPETADWAVGYAVEHGVNHFDVAPSYGNAELRLGPALQRHRDKVFLACKTQKRTRREAKAELHESLRRLRTDHFDLYQFHWLDKLEDLNTVTGPGGAWELFQEARKEGLVRFLGITGHRPSTQLEALRRMPLDTVMCPVNFIEWQHTHAAMPLLEHAAQQGLGAIGIKAISAGPWPQEEHSYSTWYRPFDEPASIAKALRFTLSQPVATAAAAGDIRLLKMLIAAAEGFTPLSAEEQKELLASAKQYKPLFEDA
ncbi:MAG: aldo/keto reductase [Armatimonadetes bacterium]|nr:aldo/keto reductase [Armatimonadota bacterium]